MRLWLREDERKPDPAPAQTDDRRAVLVGLALWLAALIALLVVGGLLDAATRMLCLSTAGVGVVLGLVGIVYLSLKRR